MPASLLTPSQVLRIVRCGVGPETYAIDLSRVRTIQRADRLERAETGTPLIGHLPSRSGPIPIYSLSRLLDRPLIQDDSFEHIIVLEGYPQAWGLIVDRVSQVTTVAVDHVYPLPAMVLEEGAICFQGAVEVDGNVILLLDPALINPDSARVDDILPPLLPQFGSIANEFYLPPVQGGHGQLMIVRCHDPLPGQRPISLGIGLVQTVEITELPKIVRVPGTTESFLGIVLWRNILLPIVDVAARLGMPPIEMDAKSRLLILRLPGEQQVLGTIVRSRMDLARLPIDHDECSRDLGIAKERTKGIVELKNETLVLLDLHQVLRS